MWKTLLPLSLSLGFLFLGVILLFLLPVNICIAIGNIRQDKSIALQLLITCGGKVKLLQTKKVFPVAGAFDYLLGQGQALLEGERFAEGRAQLQKNVATLYGLMQVATWEKLDLRVKLGSGDPARTALLVGILRYLAGLCPAPVLQRLSFQKGKKPRFLFYPAFLALELAFLLSLEFTINGFQLLYYGLKIFGNPFFGFQGIISGRRLKKWQNIQSKV